MASLLRLQDDDLAIGTGHGRTRVGHFADIVDRDRGAAVHEIAGEDTAAPGTAVMPTGATASQICSARIVDALIEKIDQAAKSYPYAKDYTIWPGPNSNTFTAWVSRAVPELQLDLPPTAIGKDYLGYRLVSQAPSGSGFQISVFGLMGVLVSAVEGIEFNFLGLSFGVDLDPPAIKLPLIGRKNLDSRPLSD